MNYLSFFVTPISKSRTIYALIFSLLALIFLDLLVFQFAPIIRDLLLLVILFIFVSVSIEVFHRRRKDTFRPIDLLFGFEESLQFLWVKIKIGIQRLLYFRKLWLLILILFCLDRFLLPLFYEGMGVYFSPQNQATISLLVKISLHFMSVISVCFIMTCFLYNSIKTAFALSDIDRAMIVRELFERLKEEEISIAFIHVGSMCYFDVGKVMNQLANGEIEVKNGDTFYNFLRKYEHVLASTPYDPFDKPLTWLESFEKECQDEKRLEEITVDHD